MKRIRNIGFYSAMIILSLPLAVINGQTDTLCFNDTILYTLSSPGSSVYNWNVQGGLIIGSSENKDSVTVVWNISEGLHTVEVTKLSDTYCTSEPKVLKVFVYKPTVDLGMDVAICEGSSEIIKVDNGYDEYLWNNQPGTNEFTVSSGGVVSLQVKDKYGCWAQDNITVIENVNPAPDFTMIVDTVNRSVSLTNLSDSLWQYHWDFGDGAQSDEYNPGSHSYSGSGKYDISLTEYTNGCSGVLVKEVNFTDNLVSAFESLYKGCAPATVTFVNHSTGADAYLWDFGNGDTSVDENPVTTYEKPGIYEVSLTASKDKTEEISKSIITVNKGPEANFDFSPAGAEISEEINFFNQSSNAVRYVWNFGDGEFSDLYEPVHSYSSTGNYDVSLKVWSETGCSDSLVVKDAITVANNCRLIFPNGFVANKNGPTGGYYNPAQTDDNNEIFHPVYRDIDEYELKIYNRWGILIFVSRDINIGWDGYYKGKLAPQDTYLYTVKAKCLSGKEISTTGGITLIY
jgi:gliding motility-associated-like protein